MTEDYKPIKFKRIDQSTREERDRDYELVQERAKAEGRPPREIFRVALLRMHFESIGKGEFYDNKVVESREKGEDYMEFIERMDETFRVH